MSQLSIFIALQVTLLVLIIVHDWINIPPFTDLEAVKKAHSFSFRVIETLVNGCTVLFPLIMSLYFYPGPYPSHAIRTILCCYFFLSCGTIVSWWIPYIFGSPEKHKQHFVIYDKTHHFLPRRGNHIVPNTLHVVLHVLVWLCTLQAFKILW